MTEIKYDLEIVSPHTVANTTGLGRGNVGAVSLRNFVIAIDSTIYAKLAQIFRTNLKNYFKLPVKYLIFTHYHADHIFGIGAFKDIVSFCSEQMLKNMQSNSIKQAYKHRVKEFIKADPMAEGVLFELPSIAFNNKLVIRDEDLYIEVIHTGGHTSGSSIVYFPYENVLFAGDLIFANMFPFAGDATCNPEHYIKALEMMKEMKPDFIIPGHGKVLKGHNAIDEYIEFFKEFRMTIKDAISDGIAPEKVEITTSFELDRPDLKTSSVNHWYNFYKNAV
jgi:glyoxylase-like metal-dependent hydrolase (beta-lactamase superfamily II)